jgi:23S rRNA (uracil1939-C5)-methyltransferase
LKVKKGQQIEVEITGIAFGGRGLVRINGLTVFVDQAVPGDRALIRIIKTRKNYAEAQTVDLIKAAPHRVNPPCVYSGFCGGCKWQFLNYNHQLMYKRQHVAESLEHIGQIKPVQVHPTIPSPLTLGYRNKMEFSFSDRKWLMPHEIGRTDIDKSFALGLHVPGTFFKVFDTKRCLLQPDLGNHILDDIRKFIKSSAAPVYGLRSHTGFWRFVMLRHSVAHDQWMVNIVTTYEDLQTVQSLAERLVVINNITSRKAAVAIGEFERTLVGHSSIMDKIGPFEFEISANSFFQTNTLGAAQLYDTVAKYSELSGTETVLDLYSGTGTIPMLLSELAKAVSAIEIAESAVADAQRNCRKNRVKNCRFLLGDIRKILPSVSDRPDVLVIDPPRAGMHKDVAKQVLAMAPNRIVYVSCNPATLARDLCMLKESYQVLEVQPVDLFPHTYHIEAVAKLKKQTKTTVSIKERES